MDSARATTEGFDPRISGLSPLVAALRAHTMQIAVVSLLTGFLGFYLVSDPGIFSPTAGRQSDVVVTSTDFLVRLELGMLVGVVVGGILLFVRTARDSRVADGHALMGTLVVGSAVLGGVFGRVLVPQIVSLLIAADRLTFAARQSILELELFFPVAVALGLAAAPTLLALTDSGAIASQLSGQARGTFVLLTVVFASLFSPPDPTTFALFATPPLAGLCVAIAWVEFR